MNGSQGNIKEAQDLQPYHRKGAREDSSVRRQTTIGANKIILELPESSFLEDDRIVGSIILDLRTKLNIKRITIQVIGELNYVIRESLAFSSNQLDQNMNLNDVLKNYKQSTSLAGIKRQKTITAGNINSYSKISSYQHLNSFAPQKKLLKIPTNKVVPEPRRGQSLGAIGAQRSRTLKKSLTSRTVNRGMTRSNTRTSSLSSQSTQATSEVFCHYLVPIFHFKRKVQPGKYEFPFNFQFVRLHAPSTDFSQENFRLKIKYTLIAEVEEDVDNDSFAEEHEIDTAEGELRKSPEQKQPLRCMANLDVMWDYKKHMETTDLYSEDTVTKKWKFTIPKPLCCFMKYKVDAEAIIPKSIMTADAMIPFTLKLEGIPVTSDITITIALVEEVSNQLIEYHDTSSTNLSISSHKKIVDGVIEFSGDIDLGVRFASHSLRSDDWNVSHTLEFNILAKSFLSKHREKISLPCLIIPPMYQKKETRRLTGNFLKIAAEPQNDDTLVLVHSKFKLEDRFDIIRNQNYTNAMAFEDEEE